MTSQKSGYNNVIARRFLRPSLRGEYGCTTVRRSNLNKIASGAAHPRNDTQFQFVNRGFQETLLLVPGWAMDHRIFGSLDLEFNYLLPSRLFPSDFDEALLDGLKKLSLGKISILGSSMGGFLAASFTSRYPQHVKELILIGMRKGYDKDGIEKIKRYIANNKAGYLYKFYHECFSTEEKAELAIFKRGLMRDYIKEMTVEELLGGLGYLGKAELKPGELKKVKTRFIHGADDKIALVDGIDKMGDIVILRGAGHLPFLRDDFKKAFYER